MSGTSQTPQIIDTLNLFIPKSQTRFSDLRAPNNVAVPAVPPITHAINKGILLVQESLARRVRLRFDIECRVSWRRSFTYKRLRGAAILLDSPNSEQAELYIEAIRAFAASLNGKWLAPSPEMSGGSVQTAENEKDRLHSRSKTGVGG